MRYRDALQVLEIIGYIEPFFYAQADFEYELCKIIRFKITSQASSQQ